MKWSRQSKILTTFALFVALWGGTYAQLVGDMQMDYERGEPCYISGAPSAFDVAWPACIALIPVVGQIISAGWAASLTGTYGAWPTPRLRIDYVQVQRMCHSY